MGIVSSREGSDMGQPDGEVALPGAEPPPVAQAASVESRPYPPSWVDRLTDRVRMLPVPAWSVYLVIGLLLSLLYLALMEWVVSTWPGGLGPTLLPLSDLLLSSFLIGLTFAYVMGLIHYLDNSAAAALARLRPVLTVDEAGYSKLIYQLTTSPARPMLFASSLGAVYTAITLIIFMYSSNNFTAAAQAMGAAGFGLIWVFNLLLYIQLGAVVYHTLHQLLMVNEIYTKYMRFNLFQPGPLYALSGLTARTAVGIGIPAYVWFQFNSMADTGSAVPNIIQTVLLGITVVVTFIWPLLGAHGLLEREKQHLQDEAASRIEATIAALHSRVDAGDMDGIGKLKEALDGLVTEQGVIHKLRTWPWRTETVSGLGVAFLLPVIIWIVQRILGRLGI